MPCHSVKVESWKASGLLGALGCAVLVSVNLHAQVRPSPVPVQATQPAPAQATRPARGTVEKAHNPHWNTTDCFYCHERGPEGQVQPIALTDVNRVCWTCHDGVRAHQEVHPVARGFAGEDLIKPEGWPTPDGQLSCVTCHFFGPGHARGGPRPERNAWMLREYTGQPLTEWCAKCHAASPAHRPFNPHVMLDEQGEVNVRNCLLCHRLSEGLERNVRLGKPDLVADEIALCVRCHTRHIDYFTPGHIGLPVPEHVKAYMLARDEFGMEGVLTREQVEPFLGSLKTPTRLPLGLNDRLVCSTCHNPHQAGLFGPDSILGIGAMKVRTRKDEPLAMRGLGKEICRGCHNQ